ncbi:MAG: histidine phosphatase family protein [Alphaproteobacteria bacterium]|nr:histidine phosphatase family protein [Alphaproteobacteria bacterium]
MDSTIYLIRHGETVWNRIGRLQGQLDAPLTHAGLAQAHAIGRDLFERLTGSAPAMAASPLGRTRQTAAIIAEHLGIDFDDIALDDRLMEITLGDHDGYGGWDAIDRDHPELAAERRRDPWNFRHPNGESSQMVQDRVRPVLEHLTATPGIHVVVAHGVVNKVFRGLYLGLTREEVFALDRPQNAYFRLQAGTEARIEVDVEATVSTGL